MPTPLIRAFDEAAETALAHPRSALALGLLSVLSAVLAAVVDSTAAALAVAAILLGLVAAFIYALLRRPAFDAPYEIYEHESLWDFTAPDGSVAVHTKRNKVRFNFFTIVLQERAWGPGDPFEDFTPDYGECLAKGSEGPEHWAVILLPESRQRGDTATLVSHRRLENKFSAAEEWIEFKIAQRCRKAHLEVRFPTARAPRDVKLWREGNGRTVAAEVLTEGERTVWRLDEKPRRGEKYRLTWSWPGASAVSA